MKHPSTRELFSYWNARRGSHPAPERSEIEPGAIRRILADVFLLGREPGEKTRIRLAGTRVCALFGRELKGVAFIDLWDADSRALIQDGPQHIRAETEGCVGAASARTSGAELIHLELLLLPLRHRGTLDARAIGSLVLLGQESWLGGDHIEAMTLEHCRYVGAMPQVVTSPASVRGGLTVYHGGRR